MKDNLEKFSHGNKTRDKKFSHANNSRNEKFKNLPNKQQENVAMSNKALQDEYTHESKEIDSNLSRKINDDYLELSKKLDEAYVEKLVRDGLSEEVLFDWEQMAKAKQRKRKAMKQAVACILTLATVACIGLVGIYEPPVAEAEPDDDIVVESTMETIDTYKSQEELPDEVKEKFLLFPEMPDGYEVTEVVHEKFQGVEKVCINSQCKNKTLYVDETIFGNEALAGSIETEDVNVEIWGDIEVKIKSYPKEKQIQYDFKQNNVSIRIQAPMDLEKKEIKRILEKAVL